jgi:hypothetical protein
MKNFNLQAELKKLEDSRRGQGRMHTIDIVLMITIMATMSGYIGYRALGDFAQRYSKELIEYLKPKNNKLPSFATARRVLIKVDDEKFGKVFTKWIQSYFVKDKKTWVSIDGKAIKGTKQKEEDLKLAHLVSFFISDSKEIISAKKTAEKSNEIPLVQEMLKTFPLTDMILTLDALHCQTKTVKAIIDSGNDYVIQVKDNQKKC